MTGRTPDEGKTSFAWVNKNDRNVGEGGFISERAALRYARSYYAGAGGTFDVVTGVARRGENGWELLGKHETTSIRTRRRQTFGWKSVPA
jgi:hypothetical protein